MSTVAAPAVLSTLVPEPAAWHGPSLAPERYRLVIPDAVLVAATNFRPVFQWDGRLRTRFNARHIVRGYEKTGRALDTDGAHAVGLMDAFLSDPAHRLDLWLERGQIQVLNNRVIVHGRTPYQDHEAAERRRHLARLWLCAGDRRQFRG